MSDELNDFAEKLRQAHGENLVSVVLYGSGASDSTTNEQQRGYNILVVLNNITPADLKAAHKLAESWRSAGNPLPLYFSRGEIEDSSDVFPMEFVDFTRAHRVLTGSDPFKDLSVPTYNLRHQLEYELRGKLIRLRTLYIPASKNPARLARLMLDSLMTFAVLFRHVIAMLGGEPPVGKKECIEKLAELIGLDKAVFDRILKYSAKEQPEATDLDDTFAGYLLQIEKVIGAVDALPVGKR